MRWFWTNAKERCFFIRKRIMKIEINWTCGRSCAGYFLRKMEIEIVCWIYQDMDIGETDGLDMCMGVMLGINWTCDEERRRAEQEIAVDLGGLDMCSGEMLIIS